MVSSHHSQFFVVSDAGKLQGAISLSELRRLIYEQDALQPIVVAGDLVDTRRPTVNEEDHLDLVMHIFSGREYDELAVVDADGLLIGSVREKDVIEARNREMLRRDAAGGLSTTVDAAGKGQTVDLGDGYQIRELSVPAHLVGRSLRQLALRERTELQVLLVRPGSTTGRARQLEVPGGDTRLDYGDRLVVAGPSRLF